MLSTGILWERENIPGCFQAYGLLSINWQQGPIGEYNTCTTHCTWRTQAGPYLEPRNLHSSIFSIKIYSAHYQRRKINTNPLKTCWFTWGLQEMFQQWCHKLCGNDQSTCDLTEDQHQEIEPTHIQHCLSDQDLETR